MKNRVGKAAQPNTLNQCWVRHAVLFCLIGSLIGCSKDPITVVTVPKERANTAYDVPSHWRQQAPSAMRALSFSIPDDHGHNGEVSVLPMPRLNIADSEIVNLWRQQVGLEPATPEEVDTLASSVTIGGETGNLFDLVNAPEGEDDSHAPRIVTAYLHADNITWFFKLTGPSHFVDAEKPAFTHFLETVNLARLQADFQQRAAASQAPPAGAGASSPDLPEWEAPAGWDASPPTTGILASYTAATEAGNAKITISALGANFGGLLTNLNRWRGQIGLPAMTADGISDVTTPISLGDQEGTLVKMTAEENGILVAIVPNGQRTWFFKMMGPPAALEDQTVSFTDFVRSVKF